MNKLTKAVNHQQAPNPAEALGVSCQYGLMILDPHLEITACTPEAREILKLSSDPVSKTSFDQLPAVLQKAIRQVRTSSKSFEERSVKLACGMVSVSIRPFAVAGAFPALVVLLKDLQALSRADQNLRQLDRLAIIGTLSASMAHEIKNALVAGKTFIDLLLEKNQDAELAGIVRRELGRIDGIVSQMLKLASPAKPAFSPIRLHETLDHSLRLVQHHLEERAIALHRSYSASSDLIGGDDYQLQQAFVNLFLNALEAMPHHGELYVSTEFSRPKRSSRALDAARSPHLRIMIKDTGPGISPENLSHLFEPFFTTKPNGTGLGLPITQRIIKEHRGDITVESELNKGATFNIMLPALKKLNSV